MFARYQQISSPLTLPLLGSVIATSVIVSILVVPSLRPTLGLQQLLLRSAFDLAIAACIHVMTVCSIWRLIRDYVEPSAGTLAVHIWAAVVWLPLIVTLNAERSLWISCIVPWAFANALSFVNLWSKPPDEGAPQAQVPRVLFAAPRAVPLWRTLLPFCVTIVVLQAGLVTLAFGHPWSASALFCAAMILWLPPRLSFRGLAKKRRRFSRLSLLQTAAVFFLISTALTPYLQKAYGLRALASFLAISPGLPASAPRLAPSAGYSGIILRLPPKPHPPIEPPKRSESRSLATALTKAVTIPFDGAYWYFKQPDTRPRADALVEQGDPIQANVRSTDRLPLAMEAHQTLPNSIAGDCCHAIRIDLLNGDNRMGEITIELLLKDRLASAAHPLFLGSLPIPSSQVKHISLKRAPVAEALNFRMPAAANGRHFDEIIVVIKPSSERALGGSKIAIQNFVLVP